MKQEDFFEALKENLELDNPVNGETNLKDLEEWDSLTAMVLIGYIKENFDSTFSQNDVVAFTNVYSLIERIGKDNFH